MNVNLLLQRLKNSSSYGEKAFQEMSSIYIVKSIYEMLITVRSMELIVELLVGSL